MEQPSPSGDGAALEELGRRLAQRRIEFGLTQGQLATQAGVSKRTVERLEHGDSTQLMNYIRILRQLDLLQAWMGIHPRPGLRPMDLLRQQKSPPPKRVRRSTRKSAAAPAGAKAADWQWGDES